ncbi:MAG: heavy metal transporter [Clostridiales bacterium]|nr:heavy metal transporter [Clostridiales bacterium]
MTCNNCQRRIEQKLLSTAGIQSANISYTAGTADITYDSDIISLVHIQGVIEKLDYQVTADHKGAGFLRAVGFSIVIVSLYALLTHFGVLNLLAPSQLANAGTGYGMLLIIGLFTSVHCIAMCGGINLSQSLPRGKDSVPQEDALNGHNLSSAFAPTLLYNLGRVISYTVIGLILGSAGFLLGGGSTTGLPLMIQGVVKFLAGLWMILMGVNMLGLFPWLRKLGLRMPKFITNTLYAEKARHKAPLIVGLLNGLMPCGPLQSMQLVAFASANPLVGALSMLLFSLGTVPLMLGLGTLVSALGKKFAGQVLRSGAVLVVVLGLAMLSQGASLSGMLSPDLLLAIVFGLFTVGIVASIPFEKAHLKAVTTTAVSLVIVAGITIWGMGAAGGDAEQKAETTLVDGKQVVSSTLSPGAYPNISIQVGTPVQWTIIAPEGSINGCNYKMNIPEYGIADYTFQPGENVIVFTPTKPGVFRYSCWMGMINGAITVAKGTGETVEETADEEKADVEVGAVNAPVPAGIKIPTDTLAVAQVTTIEGYQLQEVTIDLTDQGFVPAVVVVQDGLDVLWHINSATSFAEDSAGLLFPLYATELPLVQGDNPLVFTPSDSFDFSTRDNTFYGYIKVVEDIAIADLESIKAEVDRFETQIWPIETFQQPVSQASGSQSQTAEATVKDGVQYVTSSVNSRGYDPITVQQGIPVRWTLNAPNGSLNGCNNAIVIPAFNLKVDLKPGENLIEFIPEKSGTFAFSCWMGMIRSSITVTDGQGEVAPWEDDGSDSLPSCCDM